jgi:hypothetical protein
MPSSSRRQKQAGRAPSALRLPADSGLDRLLEFAPETQNFLALCEVEVLPLIAALAVIHHGQSGTPGTRSVPACWQLRGALSYLGFDGEVIGAMALVIPAGDSMPEPVGASGGKPSLADDGSTNGHAVF